METKNICCNSTEKVETDKQACCSTTKESTCDCNNNEKDEQCCSTENQCEDDNCCKDEITEKHKIKRREFLKLAAAGAAILGLPGANAFAGPFDYNDMDHLIPADKKFSPQWLKTLAQKGIPEVYTDKELKYIGMPIGGIACGQLYLGGDGRLWLWHIFKTEYSREKDHGQRYAAMTLGGHYANPDMTFEREKRPVDQGTVIKVTSQSKTQSRTLDNKGFKDIEFRGEYPVGKVKYKDNNFPVEVNLEAFSPFIPLKANDSNLPITVMSYKIKNTTQNPVKVEIAKWLENAVCPFIDDKKWGFRKNKLVADKNMLSIHSFADNGNKKVDNEYLSNQEGYGSMSLSIINRTEKTKANLNLELKTKPEQIFDVLKDSENITNTEQKAFGENMVGSLSESIELNAGEEKTVEFAISWYFPLLNQQEKNSGQLLALKNIKMLKLHYYNRFNSSIEVAQHYQNNHSYLAGSTRKWNNTWYKSSLPYWLLDRTFISLDCLATNTFMQFNNGRYWGWEGVECCPGTCQHVWHYTQGMARIFPSIERYFRQEIDYGIMFRKDGGMGHRDETAGGHGFVVAHDGHCGTIIRALREHKTSKDNKFLKRNYEKIKKSIKFMINEDKNKDGLLEGGQTNTLDAKWFGDMAWISSLYIGSLAVGKELAQDMNDKDFELECNSLIEKGRTNIVKHLYNGEYFIHKPDPKHNAINTNKGCHIDQVLGQSLAMQAGIKERIVPEKECKSALESIYKYNFAPDAFIYQEQHKPIKGARIYATEGEAGVIMCTWPKGGADKAVPGMDKRKEPSKTWLGPGGYFDETMNGFEYQVAAHMINEGMVEKGLAIFKAVHERYGATKRNPYNEIECGDHYSRSMASYGIFTAICGFYYHGPKGIIEFNPRITPESFEAPFTAAEAWGTFKQTREANSQTNSLKVEFGKLNLNEIRLGIEKPVNSVKLLIDGQEISTTYQIKENFIEIKFENMNVKEIEVILN